MHPDVNGLREIHSSRDMPRLHSYSEKDGFYILAHPPDAGNITYQVSSKAKLVLQSFGFKEGDKISWDIINALRVPDLIYTGEGGTSEQIPLDLEVEEKIDDLDTIQRRKFANSLLSRSDLDQDSKRLITEILGVDLMEVDSPKPSLDVEVQPHHMEDSLEAVSAENWHPQDVILISQALSEFANSGELTDARATRTYALLFGIIDTSDIEFEHADFSDYQHLSDLVQRALDQWMENQADETWGEELVLDEDEL